jgi:sensor histidine kinase regulating citrate/malate metabolism
MSEMKALKSLGDKPEKKRILLRTGHRCQDNIIMDVKESGTGVPESVPTIPRSARPGLESW